MTMRTTRRKRMHGDEETEDEVEVWEVDEDFLEEEEYEEVEVD